MLLVAFWPTYQAVAASYRAGRKTYLRGGESGPPAGDSGRLDGHQPEATSKGGGRPFKVVVKAVRGRREGHDIDDGGRWLLGPAPARSLTRWG